MLEFPFLSKCNRRFCRRYKQTIVRSAKESQHEDRNEEESVTVICVAEPLGENRMCAEQLAEFVSRTMLFLGHAGTPQKNRKEIHE